MNPHRLAAIAAILAFLVVALAGLYHSGSPAEQRRQRIDERRVNDLQKISRAIHEHWNDHDQLPANLAELVNGYDLSELPADPETSAAYVYTRRADNAYSLCASFTTASRDSEAADFWEHAAGLQCFEFELEAAKE